MVASDLNFSANGEAPLRFALDGQAVPSPKNPWALTGTQRRWDLSLLVGTEAAQPDPTRMGKKNVNEALYIVTTRIDRIYTSTQPWQLALIMSRAATFGKLADMEKRTSSDHVGVIATLSVRKQIPEHLRPLPKWLVKHEVFGELLKVELEKIAPNFVDPFAELIQVKKAMRAVSKTASKQILSKSPEDAAQRMQLLLQLGRALATNGTWLAEKVAFAIPAIHEFVAVSRDSVAITNASAYNKFSTDVAMNHLNTESVATAAIVDQRARKGSSASRLNRLLGLWNPFKRRAATVAILRDDGHLASPEADAAKALADHWGKTFAIKQTDTSTAATFLHQFLVPLNIVNLSCPTVEDFGHFLRKVAHSAPGPDGIPYAAWAAAGPRGHSLLRKLFFHQAAGRDFEASFNASLGEFCGKGSKDDDTAETMKGRPDETRPLSLKNADNKTIAAIVNRKIARPLAEWANHCQEGFVVGRQGVNNIVKIDAKARIADARAYYDGNGKVGRLPSLILFDILAAFPSVAHLYIFAILELCSLPEGLLNYLKSPVQKQRLLDGHLGRLGIHLLDLLWYSSRLPAVWHPFRARSRSIPLHGGEAAAVIGVQGIC